MIPRINRRKPIEIYFILYLAALMLLIPDLKEKPSSKNNNEQNESLFRIFPEKNILTTRISYDSLGNTVINTDSVNYIYYTGEVERVDFEFQVVNKSLNQYITVNNQDYVGLFRYYQLPDINAAIFVWRPPILDQRNYVLDVKVTATAKLKDREKTEIVKSSTQFSLVVSYVDSQTGLPLEIARSSGVGSGLRDTVYQTTPMSIGDLFMDFQDRKVSSLVGDEWENKVLVYGVNLLTELKNKPEISIQNKPENNNASVWVKQVANNYIVLAGKAPQFGSSRVKVKIVRKFDGNSIEDEFLVEPLPISEPTIPQPIFVNQKYTINPNFPDLANKTYFVKLYTDNRVLFSSNSPLPFTIAFDENLANKNVYFERYINNALYGKSYTIQIKNYPPPNIAKLQTIANNKVRMIVNTYGITNGRENFVRNIEIEGNAVYKELLGQTTVNKKEYIITQVFEITPSNDSKAFEFKIRVQDQRGIWSEWEKYP